MSSEALLREALKECSDDLAEMVDSFYRRDGRIHPAEQRRYDRDMEPVVRARALLAAASKDDDERPVRYFGEVPM